MTIGSITQRTENKATKSQAALSVKPDLYAEENPALTRALYKLVIGQELDKTDVDTLSSSFNKSGSKKSAQLINTLKSHFGLDSDNFDDTTGNKASQAKTYDRFDNAPLVDVLDPNNAIEVLAKRDNFQEELTSVIAKMKTHFGNDAKIVKKLEKISDCFSRANKEQNSFSPDPNSALSIELAWRLDPKNKGKESSTIFKDLKPNEFWLLYSGAAAVPELDSVALLDQKIEAAPDFDFDKIPSSSTDAKQWYSYLQGATDKLSGAEKNQPRSILRHLQALEEIHNPDVFKDLNRVRGKDLSDSTTTAFMNKYNQLVRNLRAQAAETDQNKKLDLGTFDYDPKLRASMEAIATISDPDMQNLVQGITKADTLGQLGAALYTLDNPKSEYNDKNPNIQAAIKQFGLDGTIPEQKFKDVLTHKEDPEEKRNFLTALLREAKMLKNEEQRTSASLAASEDPTKADPTKLFDKFRKSVNDLNTVIHGKRRSESAMRELEAHFVEFMSSGKLSPKLKAEFGKNSNLAESLNYFSKGIGDSRFNVGLVRSLFNKNGSRSGVNRFNIADIASRSDTFEDVALEIRQRVSQVAMTGNSENVPEELHDTSLAPQVFYKFDPRLFQAEMTPPDKEGQSTATGNFPILGALNLQSYFNSSNEDKPTMKFGEDTKAFNTLKEFIAASLQGVKAGNTEITDADVREFLSHKEIGAIAEDDTISFKNNGGPLLKALEKSISKRQDEYVSYNQFDSDNPFKYADLIAGRDRLIKFARDNSLFTSANGDQAGLYQRAGVTQAYHSFEYQEKLQGFASDVNHLIRHTDVNIPQQIGGAKQSIFASIDEPRQQNPGTSETQYASHRPAPNLYSQAMRQARKSNPDMFESYETALSFLNDDNPFGGRSPSRAQKHQSFGFDYLFNDDSHISKSKEEKARERERIFNPFYLQS